MLESTRNSIILWISHDFLEYSAKFREFLMKIGAKFDEKVKRLEIANLILQNFEQKSEEVSRKFAQILKLERCKGLQIL